MATAIVPQIGRQLAEAYDTTQRALSKDPEMSSRVWEHALSELQSFDPSSATREQFVEANGNVSILEQVLTNVSGRVLNGDDR